MGTEHNHEEFLRTAMVNKENKHRAFARMTLNPKR
jgi:hypothetical protein